MKLYLRNSDLTLRKGVRQGTTLLPEEHELLLSSALPEGWQRQETTVVTLQAEADHQIEIHLEFCVSEEDEPLLSLHYRILPGCRVQVPFPVDKRALGADMAFLPPWPGVFKGGLNGRPIQAGEVKFFRLFLREPSLRSAVLTSVEFVSGWQPQDVEGRPLVDALGQRAEGAWPGKTGSLEELDAYLKKELETYIGRASEQTKQLYKVLLSKGYPKELCAEIAYKNMNTDYTATRMLGYLYRVTNPRIEDLVDEMLAILSDREAIIQKKELEHAQAVINDMYKNGL